MKINKLHIDNFGRLSNVDLDFSAGINEFCNENGWGKTTLSVFIKAMFYQMGASRENIKAERKKYMPWQGGNYGGYIDFSCQKGDYRIVRSFAKTPEGDQSQLIDLSTNKEVEIANEGLGEWIFGVGKETFEMTAFFPQLNFLAAVNEQISAGVLGLDKFKFDLANVGVAMTKIKKEIAALKKNIVKPADIDRLKRQIADLSLDLSDAENALKKIAAETAEEVAKFEAISQEIAAEKQAIEQQEKIYLSKLKIENELKQKNEKLAFLLLELNELSQKQPSPKKKKVPILAICVIIVGLVLGVALGAAAITSWLVGGLIIAGSLLIGGGLLIWELQQNKKKNKIAVPADSQREQLASKVTVLREQTESLKENLSSFEGIVQPNKSRLEEKQQQYFNSKLILERLSGDKKSIEIQKDRLLQDIENLKDEVAAKNDMKGKVDEKMEIMQLAYDYLGQAKENVSTRFVGPINAQMKSLLDRFDMRGREYVVDTNFDIKQAADGGLKPFEQSSQGYQDILSFCMRFLLIGEVFKEEKPFVVLDDTFVNLDDGNFAKAQQVLEEFAGQYQILYVCCSRTNKLKKG